MCIQGVRWTLEACRVKHYRERCVHTKPTRLLPSTDATLQAWDLTNGEPGFTVCAKAKKAQWFLSPEHSLALLKDGYVHSSYLS